MLYKTFNTTADRIAEVFDIVHIGEFVRDLENGGIYMVVAAGSGASKMSAFRRNVVTEKIPLAACTLGTTGEPLAVFADGASDVPGIQLTDSESYTIRWNNHAAPLPVGFNWTLPQDLDDTQPIEFHALVSKTGATLGDATSLTLAAFFHTVGALHDADADAGGASNAVVGNATAKTVSELIRAIAAVDAPAAPASLALKIKPTDGTLGTDDFLIHAMWMEYTPK